jgi:hypothetical protein
MIAESGFEYFACLQRAGAGRGLTGPQVPHTPGRTVEDRFCEDAAQIEVVGMRLVGEPHGVGKGVVPGALVVDRIALWIASRQRLDQGAFRRADPGDQREGGAGRIIGASKRCGLAGLVPQFPREIVVRPGCVGDSPMSHRTVRVRLQRLREAGDRFLMMVAKAPVEATIEPMLGVRRGGGHLPGVGAEIIRIVHIASSSISNEVGPRRADYCRQQSLTQRCFYLTPIRRTVNDRFPPIQSTASVVR